MIILYNVDVPMARLPVANWVLIGLTSIVSIGILITKPPLITVDPTALPDREAIQVMDDIFRRLQDPPPPPLSLRRTQFSALQLLSYVLVHGDLAHLVGNMWFLFLFGNAINAKLGHKWFLLLYFLLGAVAGSAWLLFGSGKVLVGASGAIMGIVGVYLVFYPRNDVCIFYLNLAGIGTSSISSFWVVLLAMASDLIGTVFGRAGGIAYVCHLGGELLGVAIGVTILVLGLIKPTAGEQNLLQALGIQESSERFDSMGLPITRRKSRRPSRTSRSRGSEDRPLKKPQVDE